MTRRTEVHLPREDYKYCDHCAILGIETRALYDYKTRAGSWAYGCSEHYGIHRFFLSLGEGMGQLLVYDLD